MTRTLQLSGHTALAAYFKGSPHSKADTFRLLVWRAAGCPEGLKPKVKRFMPVSMVVGADIDPQLWEAFRKARVADGLKRGVLTPTVVAALEQVVAQEAL